MELNTVANFFQQKDNHLLEYSSQWTKVFLKTATEFCHKGVGF